MRPDPRTARLADLASDLGKILEAFDKIDEDSPNHGHFGCDGRYRMPKPRIRGKLGIRS